ncbi:uncharacterized protein LOC117180041 isoform X3 [Belonocnema kinseyi]|uniref:uncharacterized protein LOC117180041 isoform X3 n=1 Tax=Belonocnema kinseyi TaxID=2817044 RepID=UPI00143CDA42|nr:uncharacterized protein LOC117180041 isoform X3 [Belonocnema kinseyi]
MPGKVVFAVLLTIATLFSTSFPDVAIVTDPNETAYVNCLRNCSTNENNPFCIQYFTQIVGVGNQEFSCLNRCGAGATPSEATVCARRTANPILEKN